MAAKDGGNTDEGDSEEATRLTLRLLEEVRRSCLEGRREGRRKKEEEKGEEDKGKGRHGREGKGWER